jgi:hypothetical protein
MESRRRDLDPSAIEGWEYFDTLVPLLARLKDIGTRRDKAGNRRSSSVRFGPQRSSTYQSGEMGPSAESLPVLIIWKRPLA